MRWIKPDALRRGNLPFVGLNRRSELLRNIQAALRCIEDGIFSTCTNCDEAIGRNRLVAVPWTPSSVFVAKRPLIAVIPG